jgi:hypothetical protein
MKTLIAFLALLLSPVVFAQGAPARRRAVAPVPARHRVITLAPSKDNTLYEIPDGSLSNGAGIHLFAGVTGSGGLRRALLAFDVASQIPHGSHVTRAVLTLSSAGGPGIAPMSLHRVTANWGEGASMAPAGFIWGNSDGRGTAAQPGDATWIHTFFPNQRWTRPGGDFDAAPDATATGGSLQPTWESPAMITRVQQWLDQPATNFGWIVRGDESVNRTAKKFDSRQASQRTAPALTIEFDVGP